MSTALDKYKALIDGLTGIRDGVLIQWTRDNQWPESEKNRPMAALLAGLTPEQRLVLADVIERARSGGIHDTLVYLHDQMCLQDLRLSQGGEELPVEPFDNPLYYDWASRAAGEPWPDDAEA